jgi:hypothetical protein
VLDQNPQAGVARKKFAIVARRVTFGIILTPEVKERMAKTVIVYSQPG